MGIHRRRDEYRHHRIRAGVRRTKGQLTKARIRKTADNCLQNQISRTRTLTAAHQLSTFLHYHNRTAAAITQRKYRHHGEQKMLDFIQPTNTTNGHREAVTRPRLHQAWTTATRSQ